MHKLNKKAALELSINAIVVIVIAFVVLGLGLTLTRTIFKAATSKIPEAISLTSLEAEPSSENPLTVAETIEIKRGKTETLNIGYYNKNPNTHNNARLEIIGCIASDATAAATLTELTQPSLTSISQPVGPSESKAYRVILNENGLLGGYQYICTMAVVDLPDEQTTGGTIVESKQFFLHVTS